MSQENVELARRFYLGPIDLAATFADPEALEALRATFEPLVHPKFETVADPRYQMLAGGPSQLTGFFGLDGFVRSFGEWVGGWERWVITPTDFIEVDESRVLVVIEISGRSKAQQVDMRSQGGNLLTFSNGRLTRLELFLSRAEALEAAGVSE